MPLRTLFKRQGFMDFFEENNQKEKTPVLVSVHTKTGAILSLFNLI
jgi:hypothetical protein